jgi:hypothetical protein
MNHKQADQQCVEYVVKHRAVLVAPSVQYLEYLITSQNPIQTKVLVNFLYILTYHKSSMSMTSWWNSRNHSNSFNIIFL